MRRTRQRLLEVIPTLNEEVVPKDARELLFELSHAVRNGFYPDRLAIRDMNSVIKKSIYSWYITDLLKDFAFHIPRADLRGDPNAP